MPSTPETTCSPDVGLRRSLADDKHLCHQKAMPANSADQEHHASQAQQARQLTSVSAQKQAFFVLLTVNHVLRTVLEARLWWTCHLRR